MARTLIKEGLEAAWEASSKVYRENGNALEQLKAGIRAYLDCVSDRNRVRRQQLAVEDRTDRKDGE